MAEVAMNSQYSSQALQQARESVIVELLSFSLLRRR